MNNSSNLLNFNYVKEAEKFRRFPQIIDIHTHILGGNAAKVYSSVAEYYGITHTYSMTPLPYVEQVKDVMQNKISFIAVPNWSDNDPVHAYGRGFIDTIEKFFSLGSKIVKFWSAPRGVDIGGRVGRPDLLRIDSPERLDAMKHAAELGMIFMAHIADPDTWFATKYSDINTYGDKLSHYSRFRKLLDRFHVPWIAAHMGGWPEDLCFLDQLLENHTNLYIDCSATKWMVRELSKHSHDQFVSFFTKWSGRIIFGSDIVTNDAHLTSDISGNEKADQANSEQEAFDLYASRYWALRTLLETNYRGHSPIADPDLALVDSNRYEVDDSPMLYGRELPISVLNAIYSETAAKLGLT